LAVFVFNLTAASGESAVAHSLSAKKRIRQNEKGRARNRARKDLIKEQIKGFTAALASGKVDKAETALRTTTSRLDKVAAKGTIHKNAAARKRSRLTKRLNALRSGTVKPVPVKGTAAAKA
jgi:small subunit ribosomal protein S20